MTLCASFMFEAMRPTGVFSKTSDRQPHDASKMTIVILTSMRAVKCISSARRNALNTVSKMMQMASAMQSTMNVLIAA